MSFLAPLFLLGAAAIALPVILHLIRRSSRERMPFSSLMFLLPTPPRVTRRSRLENILLLILRCAVISLLAFAFARPFLSRPVAADPNANAGQKIVVLVDASASMRRAGVWQEAQAKAKEIVRGATAADQVACMAFDHTTQTLMDFEQWSLLPQAERAAVLSGRLDEMKPGWGITRLGAALVNACELFESADKDERSQRRIVLITDLQEGSRLDGLQGFEWPKRLNVQIESVAAKRTSNAGLHLAGGSAAEAASRTPANNGVRLRIGNASDSKREQFQIGWSRADGQLLDGSTLDVYVPPGQSRIVTLPRTEGGALGDRVLLKGDDDEFDNTAFVVPLRTDRPRIVFLGTDRETDPAQLLFYLRRAFQETPRLAVEILSRDPGTVLAEKDLAEASLVAVSAALSEDNVQAVRNFLAQGRTVLVPMTSLSMAPTLAAILGQPELPAEEASAGSYAMLAQIDFGHPLFAPFADPRYSDFTKIHFWKHRRLNLDKVEGARVVARFDDGAPALSEMVVGKGRLWVLASGWHPEDSQLALSSKFVPLLFAMLEQTGGLSNDRSDYVVGEPFRLPQGPGPVTVRKPDASEITVSGSEPVFTTDQPGIYTVSSGARQAGFAVNLAPEESRTAPLLVEELERLGMPLAPQAKVAAAKERQRLERLQSVQLENRQKLWRWLIVAALMVLVMETWLAGRLTRRPAVVAAET